MHRVNNGVIEFWYSRMYKPIYSNNVPEESMDKFGENIANEFNNRLSEIEKTIDGEFNKGNKEEKCEYRKIFKYIRIPTLRVQSGNFRNIKVRMDINPCTSRDTSTKIYVIPGYVGKVDKDNIVEFLKISRNISEKIVTKICEIYFELLRNTDIEEIKRDINPNDYAYILTASVLGSNNEYVREFIKNSTSLEALNEIYRRDKDQIDNIIRDLTLLCDNSPIPVEFKNCDWFIQSIEKKNGKEEFGLLSFIGTKERGHFIGIATDPHPVLTSLMLTIIQRV